MSDLDDLIKPGSFRTSTGGMRDSAAAELAQLRSENETLRNRDMMDRAVMTEASAKIEELRADLAQAQARIAELTAERDALFAESDAVHRAVNEMCGTDTSTIEAVQHVINERDAARAEVDKFHKLQAAVEALNSQLDSAKTYQRMAARR